MTREANLSSSNAQATPVLFDLEAVAISFQEVAVDIVRGETTEFVSRWYKASRGDADMTVWIDGEKRFVKHQLSIYGQVVEWNPIHGTRTGLIVEHESEETSEIIRFDKKCDSRSVEQAIDLISKLAILPEQERQSLIYNFRESPRLHARARERALKAWAPQTEELMSDKRPGFWKKLGAWVFGK